jgi:hypothetical protein
MRHFATPRGAGRIFMALRTFQRATGMNPKQSAAAAILDGSDGKRSNVSDSGRGLWTKSGLRLERWAINSHAKARSREEMGAIVGAGGGKRL